MWPSPMCEVIYHEDFALDENPSEDLAFILRMPNDVCFVPLVVSYELSSVCRFGAVLSIDGPFPGDFILDLRL